MEHPRQQYQRLLRLLIASRDAGVKRFVYAASSSTYGDHPGLPKVEEQIGKPLSPYAVTKYVNELYGDVFARAYGVSAVGLRYFNVFGPRQDPNGAYAAVMPMWFAALLNNDTVYINGDGETSRDFCFVGNAVQANLLAATAPSLPEGPRSVQRRRRRPHHAERAVRRHPRASGALSEAAQCQPVYRDFRAGDVRHHKPTSSKAASLLGYAPTPRGRRAGYRRTVVCATVWSHCVKRVLIIRRDNIGDLVCTTPLFSALREALPNAYLAALVNSYNAEALRQPGAGRCVCLPPRPSTANARNCACGGTPGA